MFRHNLISMDRRTMIRWCGTCAALELAGCGRFVFQDKPKRDLDLAMQEVTPLNNSYQATVSISYGVGSEEPFQDVQILAYSEQGQQVCDKHVGTIGSGGRETVRLNCSGFPAVVTADTNTSVCNDSVMIQVIHWIGTEEQKQMQIPDEIPQDTPVYDRTNLECNESLPPDRLISVSQSSTTQ